MVSDLTEVECAIRSGGEAVGVVDLRGGGGDVVGGESCDSSAGDDGGAWAERSAAVRRKRSGQCIPLVYDLPLAGRAILPAAAFQAAKISLTEKRAIPFSGSR